MFMQVLINFCTASHYIASKTTINFFNHQTAKTSGTQAAHSPLLNILWSGIRFRKFRYTRLINNVCYYIIDFLSSTFSLALVLTPVYFKWLVPLRNVKRKYPCKYILVKILLGHIFLLFNYFYITRKCGSNSKILSLCGLK